MLIEVIWPASCPWLDHVNSILALDQLEKQITTGWFSFVIPEPFNSIIQYFHTIMVIVFWCLLFIYPTWRHCCCQGWPNCSKDKTVTMTNQPVNKVVLNSPLPLVSLDVDQLYSVHDPVVFQPISVTLTFESTHYSHQYDHHQHQRWPNRQFNDSECQIDATSSSWHRGMLT